MKAGTVLTERFERALLYATRLHADDIKRATGAPYIAHLLGVCALVLDDGGDEDEAIAALLHDALEDHPSPTRRDEIRREFGVRVLHLVEIATDTPGGDEGGAKPPWGPRKQAHLEHLAAAAPRDCRVPLADKLNNARAILREYRDKGEAIWSRFKAGKDAQLRYRRGLVTAFRRAGVEGPMLDELDRVVSELERLSGSADSTKGPVRQGS